MDSLLSHKEARKELIIYVLNVNDGNSKQYLNRLPESHKSSREY